MKFETVSYLKANAAKLDVTEPLTITQNGKPMIVIQSYDAWWQQQEAIALLKLTNFALEDKVNGRVTSKPIIKGLNYE